MEILLVWIASAALCGWIANKKNRNVGLWVGVGLLTGVIGIVIIAVRSTIEESA